MSNSARLSAAVAAGLLALGLATGCGPADAAGVTTPATPTPTVVTTTPAAASPTPAPVASATTAVVAAPTTEAAAAAPTTAAAVSCQSNEYRNSSGHCVPRPTQAPAPPPGASAICNDGSYSFSEHRRGTCSGHGGVRTWLKDLPA
jgi:hypothetical protein